MLTEGSNHRNRRPLCVPVSSITGEHFVTYMQYILVQLNKPHFFKTTTIRLYSSYICTAAAISIPSVVSQVPRCLRGNQCLVWQDCSKAP